MINDANKDLDKYDDLFLTMDEIIEKNKISLDSLNYDKSGQLNKLYEVLKPYFKTPYDEYMFFKGIIFNINFDKLDLSFASIELLKVIKFVDCTINELKVNLKYFDLLKSNLAIYATINKFILPVTMHDWKNRGKNRISTSNLTTQSNLYIELNRICNMKCEFCRNHELESCIYNLDDIIKTLNEVRNNFNNIVVGGGEPTLLIEDLLKLSKQNYGPRYNIITNGSAKVEEYKKLMKDGYYKIIFSRHAVDDCENRRIFQDKKDTILSAKELSGLMKNNTLACTCFKGGVDTSDKMIEYIKFATSIGCKSILFQTLHQEDFLLNNKVVTIEPDVIKTTIEYLKLLNFKITEPIYSTSGYVMYIAKKSDLSISFKEYRNPIEVQELWNTATKRCFDLSIAPNGDLFETWGQQYSPVKQLKL